jgi:ABC-type uncharacterized transport system substrate-binding protein
LIERDVLAAARVIGIQSQTVKAGTLREIDAAFESLTQARTKALLVSNDVFLNGGQVEQISALATRYSIPAMHSSREFVLAGGLVSYGTSLTDTYRHVGLHAGRMLKGVRQATYQLSKYARHRRRGYRMSTRREFIGRLGGAVAAAWRLVREDTHAAPPD